MFFRRKPFGGTFARPTAWLEIISARRTPRAMSSSG
jgi:hypothetical protein